MVGNAPYMPLRLLNLSPEGKDALVGGERKLKTAEIFLPLIDPRLDTKTILTTNSGPQQIAALYPDVVITM